MNTNHPAAFGTSPLFFFVLNKLSYADLLYAYEIVNHTHTVLGSITLIQMIEPGTGKAVTTEAIPGSTLRYFLTILDSACRAGFRFDTVVTATTGACLLISHICATETTIHSTGSDQGLL